MKLLFLVSLLPVVVAFYSVSYHSTSDSDIIIPDNAVFYESPSAEHVADIYSRIAGLPPLFNENEIQMPARNVFSSSNSKETPLLLEIHGGVLPRSIVPVIKGVAFSDNNSKGPVLNDVVKVLENKNINIKSDKIIGTEDLASNLEKYLSEQDRPVIILHHESPSSHHYIQRSLLNANNTNSNSTSNPTSNPVSNSTTVTPLTEFQISQYQICLWTGILMVCLVYSAICGVCNMEVIPDSILFAKFISSRTSKHD